ncbi:MAG: hypothetical protein H3C62_06445 [Gemmatimonadaceae bacterium]|nr:hypothetical protein [Gemmatimonadaceae bacterium]
MRLSLALASIAAACGGGERRDPFPSDLAEEAQFRRVAVAAPYRMTAMLCGARIKRAEDWTWPIHTLTIDTRRCRECTADLQALDQASDILTDWVVVMPDSADARLACKRLRGSYVYVVDASDWTYPKPGGAVRRYVKSSPASSELLGAHSSVGAALQAIAQRQ